MLEDLYSVISADEISAEVLLSDENHSVFKAHFPGNPILPGFVHLEIIADIFKMDIVGVKKAKYSEIVYPSSRLKYIKNVNKITVICNDKDVASFNIV
jgi:3-hydroxyacyl-[acyl-carrier-protein] dehydratase